LKKQSEKKIERLLFDETKRIGGLSLKLLPDFFNGIPDRLCLFPEGRLFFIETKSTGDKPRKLQLVVHRKLRKLGFKVRVIETVEQVKTFIRYVEEGGSS
jgi:hypothetical protein